jgi:hypothetical protein
VGIVRDVVDVLLRRSGSAAELLRQSAAPEPSTEQHATSLIEVGVQREQAGQNDDRKLVREYADVRHAGFPQK